MARQRSPERDKAKRRFIESGGTISTKDNAAAAGVSEGQLRTWKSKDGWAAELAKKKRGGQRGNKNAAGAGAPPDNKNAETHGAYSAASLAALPEHERAQIEAITLDARENMLRELRALWTKEADLRGRIARLENAGADALHTERVMEMHVPRGKDDKGKGLALAMKTTVKAAPFDMVMKLVGELNRVHGRIVKLIDTIKAYEMDNKRLELEQRKYMLMKQKAAGVYDIDVDSGEIIDDYKEEDNKSIEEGSEIPEITDI